MRAFRCLQWLYPSSFRAEYGGEMAAVFVSHRRRTSGIAVAALWTETIADVLVNAPRAHWDILRQDLRTTSRSLRRTPGFALAAIVVAALGIGATTAAFSIADHVLVRPLPFLFPERLVRVFEDQSSRGYPRLSVSPANYRDWARMGTTLNEIAAYRGLSVNLISAGTAPERIDGASATASLFPILGVPPAIGRVFSAEDDQDGASATVLLSARLWQSHFSADPGIVGRKLLLDGEPYVVIGVMPPEFTFPSRDALLWTAMRFAPLDFADRTNIFLDVIGRLKPGVTLQQARVEFRAVAAELGNEYPNENSRTGAAVELLRDQVSPPTRTLLIALAGASACVLLIACSNLASLLLARALGRRRELAVRAALGAGHDRLVRQVLTESALLTAAGGVLGVVIAIAAVPALAALAPHSLPISELPAVDGRLLALATLVTMVTGVGVGVIPALRSGQTGLAALGDGARAGSGRRTERLRSTLVAVQIAASVLLLIVSGLLIRSLWRIESADPGFRVDRVMTARTSLSMSTYAGVAARTAFYDRVLTAVRREPGVTSAAYTSFLPMTVRGGIFPVTIEGHARDPQTPHVASVRFITPGFFATLGIPVRMGRDVTEADTRDAPWVAVVSESFAAENWPGEYPISRRFTSAFHERTVVGVVGDIAVRGLLRRSEPQVYLPAPQIADGYMTWFAPKDLVVKASVAAGALAGVIRRIVREADPDQPISDLQALEAVVGADATPRVVQVRVLLGFAALACLLAGLGINGLLSFNVSARVREIGLRVALGATPCAVLGLVVRRSAMLVGMGLVSGALAALLAGRALSAMLVGVSPTDLATYATATTLALTIAIVGSLVPAIRAVRIDPLQAIRHE